MIKTSRSEAHREDRSTENQDAEAQRNARSTERETSEKGLYRSCWWAIDGYPASSGKRLMQRFTHFIVKKTGFRNDQKSDSTGAMIRSFHRLQFAFWILQNKTLAMKHVQSKQCNATESPEEQKPTVGHFFFLLRNVVLTLLSNERGQRVSLFSTKKIGRPLSIRYSFHYFEGAARFCDVRKLPTTKWVATIRLLVEWQRSDQRRRD